ncbi:MAG: MFS transporter [Streptococcaceae bacterium]|nr:MFS transporter [Streptococcaceae bacterium]
MKKQTNVFWVTVVVFVAMFMNSIEGTIVITAMPTIVGSLQGIEYMNWVFAIYLLTQAMTTAIYGKLADMFGRKPVLAIGLVIFMIGSLLSAMSSSMFFLIIARAIQGIGTGSMFALPMTLLADMYEPKKRAKVMGFSSAVWGLGAILGPLGGGFLLLHLSWRWIFFINLPIGLVLIALLYLFLHEEDRIKQKAKIDYKGNFLLMLAILSLLLGVQFFSEEFLSLKVFILFSISLASFVEFYRSQKKNVEPLISLKYFKNRDFIVMNIVGFFLNAFLGTIDVYVPMWLQGVNGQTPTIAGLVMAPMSILWMFGSNITGNLLEKYAINKTLLIGTVSAFIVSIFYLLIPQQSSIIYLIIVTGLVGFGLGIAFTTFNVGGQMMVEKEEVGVVTGVMMLIRTLGQTIMIAIYGVVFNNFANNHLTNTNVQHGLNAIVNAQTAKQLPQNLQEELRRVLLFVRSQSHSNHVGHLYLLSGYLQNY